MGPSYQTIPESQQQAQGYYVFALPKPDVPARR
jgi:hypothetical protein